MASSSQQLPPHTRNIWTGWQSQQDNVLRTSVLQELQAIYARLRPDPAASPAATAEKHSFLCGVEAQLYTTAASKAEYADSASLEVRLMRYMSCQVPTPPPTARADPAAQASPSSVPQPAPTSASPSKLYLSQPQANNMPSAEAVGAQRSPMHPGWAGQQQQALHAAQFASAAAAAAASPFGMAARETGEQRAAKRSRQSTPSQGVEPTPQHPPLVAAQQAQQAQQPAMVFQVTTGPGGSVQYQHLLSSAAASQQQQQQHVVIVQQQQQQQPLARTGSAPPALLPASDFQPQRVQQAVAPALTTYTGVQPLVGRLQTQQPAMYHTALQQPQLMVYQPGQQPQLLAQQQPLLRAPSAPPDMCTAFQALATCTSPQLLPSLQQQPAAMLHPSQQQPAAMLHPSQQQPAAMLHPSQQQPAAMLHPPQQQPAAMLHPSQQQPAAMLHPSQQQPPAMLHPPQQQPLLLPARAHQAGQQQHPQQLMCYTYTYPTSQALPAVGSPPQQLRPAAAGIPALALPAAMNPMHVPAAAPAVQQQQQLMLQQQALHQHLQQQQLLADQAVALAAGAGREEDNESTGSHTSPATVVQSNASQVVSAASELLICPLTRAPLVDPVLADDGRTYERTAIEQWLQRSRCSPVTGQPLSSCDLKPNLTLKALADVLRQQEQQGQQQPQQPQQQEQQEQQQEQ